MRLETQGSLWAIAGSACMLVNVFARPMGIERSWGPLCLIAAVAFFYLSYRAQVKATAQAKEIRGDAPMPRAPRAVRKRRFWIIAVFLIVSSGVFLPLLPYVLDDFKPAIYWEVIPFDVILQAGLLYYLWKKMVGPEDTEP